MPSAHLAIVSPYSDLRIIPCVYGMVRHLEAQGIQTTLFVPGAPETAMGEVDGGLVQVHGHFPNWNPHGVWRWLSAEQYMALFAWRQCRRDKWTAILAIDAPGLIHAQLLNRWLGLPIWYWSLEILFDDELSEEVRPYHSWRQQEKTLLPDCVGGIIQDPVRMEAFVGQNPSFAEKPMVLMPNSSPGPARRRKSDYLHRRFNLSAETRIALYSGSFSASSMVDDIALSTRDWPEGWVFVIHSRHGLGRDGHYLAARVLEKACSPGRVYFSPGPTTLENLADIHDSADLGIVFYGRDETNPLTGRNCVLQGYSSGKINAYLQAGLPVVVNRYSNIHEWVDSSGCGRSVCDAEELGTVIREMAPHLARYSEKAVECFERTWRIEPGLAQIWRSWSEPFAANL